MFLVVLPTYIHLFETRREIDRNFTLMANKPVLKANKKPASKPLKTKDLPFEVTLYDGDTPVQVGGRYDFVPGHGVFNGERALYVSYIARVTVLYNETEYTQVREVHATNGGPVGKQHEIRFQWVLTQYVAEAIGGALTQISASVIAAAAAVSATRAAWKVATGVWPGEEYPSRGSSWSDNEIGWSEPLFGGD